MPRKKRTKPLTFLQPQNQIVPNNSENETVYDGVDSKWQDLCMELLMHILMFVDDRTVIIASGVCTGWKEAICFGVQQLSLSWCKQNMNNLFLSTVPKFTQLRSLNLYQYTSHLNDQALEMVAKYCHDLRALYLPERPQLTDKAFEALAHGCNVLEKLFITGCYALTDSALIILSEKCNKLSYLSLWSSERAATDRFLLALAYYCRGLQFVNLGLCKKVTDVGVTDQSVIALAENCHHLRSLGLALCKNITDTAMYSLVDSRVHRPVKPNVKHKGNNSGYNSEHFFRSRSSGVSRFFKYIPYRNWEYMESVLNDQEDYGLVHLNIRECTSLSAPAVQAVCDTFPALHTCRKMSVPSLIMLCCPNLTSVHCVCAVEAFRERRNRDAS